MKENVPITDPVWMVDPNWISKTGGFAKDMTMRDHYAGQALHGILTRKVFTTAERISEVAYEIADAMLAAREAK
jgi:hypothetical protein